MPKRFRSRKALFVGVVLVLAAAVATAPLYAGGGGSSTRKHVKVELKDANGATVGKVRLSKQGMKVAVYADVMGLSPGFHGFHVHAVGECTPPFTSAGGHYNPDGTTHGDHAGDLPSLLVMDDGTAELLFKTDRFTIAELFDGDGSAVVVHAGRDNYANIPDRYHSHTEDVFGPDSATLGAGDAGGRVACGVVE